MDLIKTHLDEAAKGADEHKSGDPIEEMNSVPIEPVPIEAPDTTDDVSKHLFLSVLLLELVGCSN